MLATALNQAEASTTPTLAPSIPETPQSYLIYVAGDKRRELKLAQTIISREGGWSDPTICNQEFGCRAGQGLFQVIPSTERGCEKYFGREMDMKLYRDNIDCGWHLLTVNGVYQGIGHWDDLSWKRRVKKEWGSGPYYLDQYGF